MLCRAVAVEAVEDNLLAKEAGNESIDGRMMACKVVAAARKRNVGGSLVAVRRWRQRDSATMAADWRRRCGGVSVRGGGSSAKSGGSAQRDSGSAVAAAGWQRWWRQRNIVTSAARSMLQE